MLRLLLIIVLVIFVVRAVWRLLDGVIEGIVGRPVGGPGAPRGVHMVRDPVCGTFVVPGQALAISDGSQRVFFCSARCRDAYRAKSA